MRIFSFTHCQLRLVACRNITPVAPSISLLWALTGEGDDGVDVDRLDGFPVSCDESQHVSLHTELGRTHCTEGIDKPESVPLARGHCEHFQRGVGYEASVGVLEGRHAMLLFTCNMHVAIFGR
jgi:hypothetical protein